MGVLWFVGSLRYDVGIDPDKGLSQPGQVFDAGLLGNLAPCRSFDRDIIDLDMPPWLQPSVELRVMNQKNRTSIG